MWTTYSGPSTTTMHIPTKLIILMVEKSLRPNSSGSKVQAEHSYKYINALYASNLPFIREIQYRTLDKSSFFNDNTKGDYEIPNEMRIQLPAIAIEIVPSRTSKALELGNVAQKFIKTDVLFHCLAEDEMTRNKLVDIISLQADNHVTILDPIK